MKKIVIALIIILILTAGLFYKNWIASTSSRNDSKPVFKIGVIGPLTGDAAVIGIPCRQAVDMAVADIGDDAPVTYKVIAEDDLYTPSRAAMVANKLTSVDKVDVLITCAAISASAVVHVSNTSKTPMIAIATTETELLKSSPYAFIHWTSPEQDAVKALELLKKWQAKKIITFSLQHPGVIGIRDALHRVAGENGIAASDYLFMPAERNFAMMVEKAAVENADVWFIETLSPTADILLKTIKDKGIKVRVSSIEIPSFLEDKSPFEGLVYVDVAEGNPDILNQYREKFDTQNTFGVGFAYDAMNIFNEAVKRVHAKSGEVPDTDTLMNEMMGIQDFHGAVGSISVPVSRWIQSEAVIKTIRNGQPILLEE